MGHRSLVAGLALGVCLAAIPVLGPSQPYLLDLGFLTFVFITQALAWNILGGFAGQISFGYAAFFGLGAYTTALLWLAGWPPPATYAPAGLVAAIFALAIGLPTFRLAGPYFSIATIGVGEAMRVLALNWEQVTGGASGLNLPTVVPDKVWFYYVSLGVVAAVLAVCAWIRGSRFGLGLFALSMDQAAAESLGVNTARYKNLAHMAGAFIVGSCGGLYATYFQYVHPDQVFGFQISIGMVLMPVIGGIGTLWGPVAGGALYYAIEDTLLTAFPTMHLLVYGTLLVLIILFEPLGLVGFAERLFSLFTRRIGAMAGAAAR